MLDIHECLWINDSSGRSESSPRGAPCAAQLVGIVSWSASTSDAPQLLSHPATLHGLSYEWGHSTSMAYNAYLPTPQTDLHQVPCQTARMERHPLAGLGGEVIIRVSEDRSRDDGRTVKLEHW